MKTLKRYLGREILGSTFLIFAALLLLFAFFDLINELRDLGNGNYEIGKVLLYVSLSIPGHIYELFPIAALIGALFAISQLVANSEYTVMRTAGVSLGQITWSLLRVGLLFVVLTFVVGELVAPASEQLAKQVRMQAMNSMVAREFQSGFWFKQEQTFVNIQNVLPDRTLMGLRIFEFDAGHKLQSIRTADFGKFIGNHQWRLRQVVVTEFNESSKASVSRAPEVIWRSVLEPTMLNALQVDPQKLALPSLYQYMKHLENNKQRSSRFEIALWIKLLYPLAVLVMMLLALPFAYFQRRAGGVGFRIFAGILLGLSFHLSNRLFTYLGVLGDWPPFFTAVFPMLTFLAAAIFLLWRLERR
jgi:lipopolysaccharide export system permease protein